MVIGGYAVRFYGCMRETNDLDLFTEISHENSQLLFDTLTDVVGHELSFTLKELSKPKMKVSLRNAGYPVEILTSIDGLSFDEAYNERVLCRYKRSILPFISKRHLILSKQNAGREKDLKDIECLESVCHITRTGADRACLPPAYRRGRAGRLSGRCLAESVKASAAQLSSFGGWYLGLDL